MSKLAHRIILTCAGLVVLSCLAVVLVVVWPFLTGGGVEAEIAAIRAKGEPTKPTDLIRPEIPDSENAAIIYDQAFGLLNRRMSTRASTEVIFNFLGNQSIREDPEAWSKLKRLVEQHQRALALAHEAARRSKCRFPSSQTAGAGTGFAHGSRLGSIARLLAAEAILRASKNDIPGALSSIHACIRAGEAVADEPSLASQLRRFSISGTYSRGLLAVMKIAHISEAQARTLDSELARVDLNSGLVSALQGDRAMAIGVFEELRSKGTRKIDEIYAGFSRDRAQPRRPIPGSSLVRLLLRPDEACYIRTSTKMIETAGLPYREMRAKAPAGNDPGQSLPKYAVMSRMLLHNFDQSARARDEAIASIVCARVALGLQAYRARHGTYPQNLKLLESDLRWTVPNDPFSGRELVYKRAGAGFLLYSIGPDLKDDGGLQSKDRGYRYSDLRHGDVVWRVDR